MSKISRALGPISPHEFKAQLQVIGAICRDPLTRGPRNIAVCVSGGADSMALAYLLRNTWSAHDCNKAAYRVHGFIVDHGARDGSRAEALTVSNSLHKLGIPSSILVMDWPSGIEPTKMPSFEENARRARYELVAHGAQSHGCTDLFVGHHYDDNIETLLFRMTRQKRLPLLSMFGIKANAQIPLCDHIPGAHPYSISRAFTDSEPSLKRPTQQNFLINEVPHMGMKLYRPLLSFPKTRIIATCHAHDIPYVNDKTNFDPTFATRNTIRYLRSFKLPEALQGTRIAKIQDKACSYLADIEDSAKKIFEDILSLNVSSEVGVVSIILTSTETLQTNAAAQYFMARSIELVAPLSTKSFPTLTLMSRLQELIHMCHVGSESLPNHKSIPCMTTDRTILYVRQVWYAGKLRPQLMISRQPMRQGEVSDNTITFQIHSEKSEQKSSDSVRSEEILWDGRFWIRLASHQRDIIPKIVIRPYSKRDEQELKRTLKTRKQLDKFHENLRKLMPTFDRAGKSESHRSTPASILYTLPVLTYEGVIVAFPTLGLVIEPSLIQDLQWQIKYRRINRVLSFFEQFFPT